MLIEIIQPPFQQILTFALGASTLHGFQLTAIFLFKNRNLPLAATLAAVTVYLANYLLFLTGIIRFCPAWLGVLSPFIFLAGPGFYFFVKTSLVPGSKFQAMDWLHLLPFAWGWARVIPVLRMPLERKKAVIEWLLTSGEAAPWQQTLQGNMHLPVLFGYALAARFLAKRVENEQGSIENQQKTQWMRRFSAFFMLLLLCDFGLKMGFSFLKISPCGMEYLLAGLLAVAVLLVGWHALGGMVGFPKILPETHTNGKYKTSSLDAEKLEAVQNALLELMKTEKPYLDPDLKITKLGTLLCLSSHHLSQVLNEKLGVNFNDFVNSYRVEAVKAKLADARFAHFSMEAIGWECGFSNKTTFYRVFKKMTGQTPKNFAEAIAQKAQKQS